MWQQVQLPEQIPPRDTLVCFWGVKQPANTQEPLPRELQLWVRGAPSGVQKMMPSNRGYWELRGSPGIAGFTGNSGVHLEFRGSLGIPGITIRNPRSSHITSDLKLDTPVTTLPDVGFRIGWLGQCGGAVCKGVVENSEILYPPSGLHPAYPTSSLSPSAPISSATPHSLSQLTLKLSFAVCSTLFFCSCA